MQKLFTSNDLIRFYFGECSREEEKMLLGDLQEIGVDADVFSDEIDSFNSFSEQGPSEVFKGSYSACKEVLEEIKKLIAV